MGSRRRLSVIEHIDFKSDKAVCKHCNAHLNPNRIFNLKTHLTNKHNIKFEKLKTVSGTVRTTATSTRVDITKQQLVKSYIGLITEGGFSFSAIDSEHMKNIVGPLCKEIELQSEKKFSLNANNCKKFLAAVAKNTEKSVHIELKNKLISLTIEAAPKVSQNILGIFAHYLISGAITSRFLGIIELRDTDVCISNILSTKISNLLNKYYSDTQQIVSIISDNVSEVLLGKLPNCSCSDSNQQHQQHELMAEKSEAIEELLQVADIEIFQSASYSAHWCVLNCYKNDFIHENINNCRKLVTCLQNNSSLYAEISLDMPRLDCLSRTGSTYQMLECLQDTKLALETIKLEETDLITADLWDFINAYCLVFGPLQKAITKFQEEQLHYGDFYAQWLKCKLLTQKILQCNSENKKNYTFKIANVLLESLDDKTAVLFSNSDFLASLYLDPRFHRLLSAKQKNTAIYHLKKLWLKYKTVCCSAESMEQDDSKDDDPLESKMLTDSLNLDTDNEEDILDSFLLEKSSISISSRNVNMEIENLSFSQQVSSNTNVLEFWREKSLSDPELYILSNMCFAIPTTQILGEQFRTALKPILANNRNRLKTEELENILMGRMNPKYFDETITSYIGVTNSQ